MQFSNTVIMENDSIQILHKEIDLIQSVITRMQNNSFLIKAWFITLASVLLAITKDTIVLSEPYSCAIILFPLILFWYLDAYFLHKEKCYRKLYSWVVQNRSTTNAHLYDLDYKRFESSVPNVGKIMFTETLWPFYGLVAVLLVGITIYNFMPN